MGETWDVAIAGGGVMGSSIAYALASDPGFDGRVLVIERDPSYGACATTRSWGGVRQQFSNKENILMGLYGVDFVRRAHEILAVDGEDPPDLGFKENGYLFLASERGRSVLEANQRLQAELGAHTVLLEPAQMEARFSWLNTEGLALGCYGESGEGWIDPSALLHAFRRKALSLGVTYLTDEVVALERDGGRIVGLETKANGRFACGQLVKAAGPWSGYLAALAGLELPVRPRKRMSYVYDCRTEIPKMPLTIDTNGVVARPEGGQYISIVSPDPESDPDSHDLDEDYTIFEEIIWPSIAHRIPAFEAIKLTGAWAGHYDYNTLDQNAILGPHPEVANFLACTGFSGHGLQQSPAAGRALAELILHGEYRSLDLSVFNYARIVEGRPIYEQNVV
ncbi:MAG: FAD-binding oxidoreductase [Pseudomonadota bacterium]